MTTLLSILYSLTGATSAPAAARRIIGVSILIIITCYGAIKADRFLTDFKESVKESMSVMQEVKGDVTELKKTTATKGDMKIIEIKVDKLQEHQEKAAVEIRANREKFNYFIDHYEDDSSEAIKNELDRIKDLLINQKMESIPFDLTTYKNGRKRQGP